MNEILKKRVLAIGAHPDDLEIGCGGTLIKMSQSGSTLMGLVLTQGERGGDPAVRGRTAMVAGKIIGFVKIKILDLPDTHLHELAETVFQRIEESIAEFKPDLIITHSRHDYHPDHVAVHQATMSAARGHSSILCYESPSATSQYQPNFFVDVSQFVDTKLLAISEHYDQRKKDYVSTRQILAKLLFRGAQGRVEYAEGFEAIRLLSSSWGGF